MELMRNELKNKKHVRNRFDCRITKEQLIREFGHICFHCGFDVGKKIQFHHVIPCYAGGSDYYNNGSLLCPKCHPKLHIFQFGTDEYTEFTNIILQYKEANRN